MASSDPTRQVVDRLKRTRKYRHLCEDTLTRVAGWALCRHPGAGPAVKAAKRKLHQVYGAYFNPVRWDRVEALLDSLSTGMPEAGLRAVCSSILRCHASTAERLPIMAEFYPALFGQIGQPRTLLDLACGLNPFALPFMGLAAETAYRAWDIYTRLIGEVNRFLGFLGHRPGGACRDLLASPPGLEADVIFLLKSIPCLEQQEKGAGVDLLRRLRAPYVVVSFPSHSLGGKGKGMVQHYEGEVSRMVDALKVSVRRMAYPGETFYILSRH